MHRVDRWRLIGENSPAADEKLVAVPIGCKQNMEIIRFVIRDPGYRYITIFFVYGGPSICNSIGVTITFVHTDRRLFFFLSIEKRGIKSRYRARGIGV